MLTVTPLAGHFMAIPVCLDISLSNNTDSIIGLELVRLSKNSTYISNMKVQFSSYFIA